MENSKVFFFSSVLQTKRENLCINERENSKKTNLRKFYSIRIFFFLCVLWKFNTTTYLCVSQYIVMRIFTTSFVLLKKKKISTNLAFLCFFFFFFYKISFFFFTKKKKKKMTCENLFICIIIIFHFSKWVTSKFDWRWKYLKRDSCIFLLLDFLELYLVWFNKIDQK